MSDPTAHADTLQHVQQYCSTMNPCLHCQLSSMLRIFAYLDAAGHVGDVSYSDYLPFNTGGTTR